jgi:hypothetical protein
VDDKGTQKLPCKVNPLGHVPPTPACDVVLIEPVLVPWAAHNEVKAGANYTQQRH